jgi:hypothetical protein
VLGILIIGVAVAEGILLSLLFNLPAHRGLNLRRTSLPSDTAMTCARRRGVCERRCPVRHTLCTASPARRHHGALALAFRTAFPTQHVCRRSSPFLA